MNTITIYTTATCGFCHMLTNFLDDHSITYDKKRADENEEYAHELYELSGQLGVPFSVITDDKGEVIESILGFDVVALNRLINNGTIQKQ